MNRTRTSKNAKRLLVWLLTLTMVFGLLPMAAFADETVVEPVVEEPVQEPESSSEPTEAPSEPSEEPTQEPEEDPMDEPSEEELIDEADVLAADETDVIDESSIAEPDVSVLPSADNNSIRAVMLDCGRKYFTVAQIERLIDTMVQYKYNQLQLSFGNGGCRFLLDNMDLKFGSESGTITMESDTVKTNIKKGNVSFNGDESYLTQSDMDTIISYANGKGISIVPMLNMPGHAAAIVYDTKYSTSGNLNVNELEARNYGYALLSKYVDYFKVRGCTYFSFGADESGFTGAGMNSFINGCAKIIANAGMRPRAFNDATNANDVSFPTYVQISYWHNERASKSASNLANAGYEMLNTHGRWYYVIKTAQNDEIGTKYWQGTVNTAATSVELPVMKATKMDEGKWVGLNEYFDNNPGSGSTVSNSKGTMFCIWCDASQNAYLTGDQVISANENYGALYQLQALAEHYWGNDISTGGGESGGGSTGGDAGTVVELKVGKTSSKIATTAAEGAANTNDAYIATASVTKGGNGQPTTKAITPADGFSADKHYIIYSERYNQVLTGTKTTYSPNWYSSYSCLKLDGAVSADSSHYWTIAPDGSAYTVKYQGDDTKRLNVGNNTATLGSNGSVSLSYNDGYWNISNSGYYLNNLGGSEKAGGWKNESASTDAGSRWTIYEIVPGQASSNVLTFTGTGEGNTTASIGGVEYTIKVTAPETTENKTLNFNESYTLPAGAEASVVSGGDLVTIADGKVTARAAAGSAVVTAVTKNGGGKVTARYTYNITISEVDLNGVAPLSVELWITNRYAGGTHNGKTYAANETGHIVSVAADDAYGEDGVLLENLVPTNGVDEGGLPILYWKGTKLSSANKQTHTGTDMTGKGTDFLRIRYYEDNWQYNSNGEWINVITGDQIIAYYMQVYNTSPEIVTAFRDYGGIAGAGGGEYDAGWFAGYRGVGTAVVYPEKTMSPDGDDGIWNNTLICYYEGKNGGGTPGFIKVFNNEDFRITKITITHGVHKDADGKTGANATKTWNSTTSSVEWEKTTNDAGDKWYDETVIWESNGQDYNETITLDDTIWGDKWKTSGIGEAFLLLFYVEPVEKEDNLKVVYWDDAAGTQINPKDIYISVKEGVTFVNGIKQTSTVNKGVFTLDDDATIENSVGVSRKFNKNITIIEGVAAKYRSGIYEYYKADISEDGKTLTLHYRIKEVAGVHSFVVDFGLPVEFTGLLSWFNIKDATTLEYLSVASGRKLTESTGSYGSIKINENTWDSMTYTLDKPLSGVATIPLFAKLKDNGGQSATAINVIPASNVYYEDGFAKFNGGQNTASKAKWEVVGKETTAYQALSELGSGKIYGYDGAYENSTMFSMGSAHKVTVTSAMRDGWNELSAWPTATFSFKGTGFDVISLTNNTSGAILVDVYNSANEKVKGYFVDNYFGYGKNDVGEWVKMPNGGDNILYQIPVIKVSDLTYDNYNVTITVFYNDAFEHNEDSSYDFWLDAIRVYEPLGPSGNDSYKVDGEGYPQYIRLRDEIAKDNGSVGTDTLFIEGKENAKVAEYTNLGPNNEVYLANGQAISFKLSTNDKIDKVQIGAKAPTGTTGITVNNDTENKVEITSATEMYYDITTVAKNGQVTITNNTGNILSLTNIKVTFSADSKVTLVALDDAAKENAVEIVRTLFAAPVVEPEKTFEPNHFVATWSKNVRAGERAVLTVKTSEDVESITVNGVPVTTYKTRTERTGWGRNALRVTYREFTYMISDAQNADYTVIAVNAEGTSSAPQIASLNVIPARHTRPGWGWLEDLFGRWF